MAIQVLAELWVLDTIHKGVDHDQYKTLEREGIFFWIGGTENMLGIGSWELHQLPGNENYLLGHQSFKHFSQQRDILILIDTVIAKVYVKRQGRPVRQKRPV